MVAGTWTGTMNLTEPQAGSDLAAVRTKAVPQGDGTYKLYGQKIFITYGEQDYTENIIHLVLARTPDAPEGVQGHLALRRAEGPGQRRRLARRRATTSSARRSSTSSASTRARRRCSRTATRRRDRLPRRRGEPRPRVHVHHDEPRALLGRARGRRDLPSAPTSARSPTRASACRAGRSAGQGAQRRADHRAPRHPAHADDDARERRGDARGRLRHGGGASTTRSRHPDAGRAQAASSLRRLHDPDRQGLVHRDRAAGRLARHPGARRHGLHRGDRRRAALPRRAHHHDLRRHDRHPGERPDRPQDGARRRRRGAGDGRARSRRSRRELSRPCRRRP